MMRRFIRFVAAAVAASTVVITGFAASASAAPIPTCAVTASPVTVGQAVLGIRTVDYTLGFADYGCDGSGTLMVIATASFDGGTGSGNFATCNCSHVAQQSGRAYAVPGAWACAHNGAFGSGGVALIPTDITTYCPPPL